MDKFKAIEELMNDRYLLCGQTGSEYDEFDEFSIAIESLKKDIERDDITHRKTENKIEKAAAEIMVILKNAVKNGTFENDDEAIEFFFEEFASYSGGR